MTKQLYRLKSVSRTYGQRTVLEIDNISIDSGKIYGLLGANGSGKSTLLKIMAFLDFPDQGEIYFMGEKTEKSHAPKNRQKAVFSPQFPIMFTGSLLYNVAYPMKIRGTDSRLSQNRAKIFLEEVGLSHLSETPARRLSGGEAQRAALARALATGAEVLLLDEPTANVDRRSASEIVQLLERIQKDRKLSIIIASHDDSLVAGLFQERIVLEEGKLVHPVFKRGQAKLFLGEKGPEIKFIESDKLLFPNTGNDNHEPKIVIMEIVLLSVTKSGILVELSSLLYPQLTVEITDVSNIDISCLTLKSMLPVHIPMTQHFS